MRQRGNVVVEYALIVAAVSITALSLAPLRGWLLPQLALEGTGSSPHSMPGTQLTSGCKTYTNGNDTILTDGNVPCHDLLRGADVFNAPQSTLDLTITGGPGPDYGEVSTGSGNDKITLHRGARIRVGAGDDTVTLKMPATDNFDVDLGPGNDSATITANGPSHKAYDRVLRSGPGTSTVNADCKKGPLLIEPSSYGDLYFSGACSVEMMASGLKAAVISLQDISGTEMRLESAMDLTMHIAARFSAKQEHSLFLSGVHGLSGSVDIASNEPTSVTLEGVDSFLGDTFDLRISSPRPLLSLSGNQDQDWTFFIDDTGASGAILLSDINFSDSSDFPTFIGEVQAIEFLECFDRIDIVYQDGTSNEVEACSKHQKHYDAKNISSLVMEKGQTAREIDLTNIKVSFLQISSK